MNLKQVKNIVLNNLPGYTLTNESSDSLSFVKNVPAQNPGCGTAFILFLLGIIPGVIYMLVARKDARVFSINIVETEEGFFSVSGEESSKVRYLIDPKFKKDSDRKTLIKNGVIVGIFLLILSCVVISFIFAPDPPEGPKPLPSTPSLAPLPDNRTDEQKAEDSKYVKYFNKEYSVDVTELVGTGIDFVTLWQGPSNKQLVKKHPTTQKLILIDYLNSTKKCKVDSSGAQGWLYCDWLVELPQDMKSGL